LRDWRQSDKPSRHDAAIRLAGCPHPFANAQQLKFQFPLNQDTVTPAVTANSAVDEIRSQAAAEVSRIAAVRRICDGRFPEFEAKAIREGWDATRCELEVLRANRPRTPAIHMHDKTINGRVLEAACL